jgi:hypothetical protein
MRRFTPAFAAVISEMRVQQEVLRSARVRAPVPSQHTHITFSEPRTRLQSSALNLASRSRLASWQDVRKQFVRSACGGATVECGRWTKSLAGGWRGNRRGCEPNSMAKVTEC